MLNPKHHYVVVSYPVHGHLNPALCLAKRLAGLGATVTFVTSISGYRRILNTTGATNTTSTTTTTTTTTTTNVTSTTNATFVDGNVTSTTNATFVDGAASINFATFDDGNGEEHGMPKNKETFLSEFKRAGSQALANLIQTFEHESCPATCLIYTPLLTWVVEVARKLGVSFAMLWIQPAALFAICHYYFNGYKDQILGVINNEEDQSSFVELPGLPKLTCRDLPSFLFPSNVHLYSITMFEELFECLKLETMITKLPPRLFVNTIEEMEITTLKMLQGMVDAIAVGPLISPSIFLGMVQSSHNCLEWLNSKDNASVVYVAFGSLHAPKRRQVEEIARGLVATGRPFVWVLQRAQQKAGATTSQGDEECVSSLIDEINKGEQGLVVDWCSQIEVLSHSSIGCFVSHCGWNSTFESLVAGVPIAGFPLWADQWTNAKLIEDVWEIGMRVQRAEDELVESEEIKRCVEMVMGEGMRGQEIRRNAKKWRDLARKTVEDNGGSADTNLFEFLEEIAKDH